MAIKAVRVARVSLVLKADIRTRSKRSNGALAAKVEATQRHLQGLIRRLQDTPGRRKPPPNPPAPEPTRPRTNPAHEPT